MPQKFNIESQRSPRILLAPLDWGLGHTTRCIPIIRYLLAQHCEVFVAGEEGQLAVLQQEFPSIKSVLLRGYRLQYSTNRWKTIVKIGLQIPGILASIRRENQWLKSFAKDKRIDAVISDNRYGFFLRGKPSVFITHQLLIKTPLGSLQRINYWFISRFSECWVPDAEVGGIAGELSHPVVLPKLPVHYLGTLCRFVLPETASDGSILILLSGPEPQRTILEEIVFSQLSLSAQRTVVVRGLPAGGSPLVHASNVLVFDHLPGRQLAQVIATASFVVSRSGYTSVMELLTAGKKCIFIPTPGQTEQEYLAKYLSGRQLCLSAKQDDFDLREHLERAERFEFAKMNVHPGPDYAVLDRFIKQARGN